MATAPSVLAEGKDAGLPDMVSVAAAEDFHATTMPLPTAHDTETPLQEQVVSSCQAECVVYGEYPMALPPSKLSALSAAGFGPDDLRASFVRPPDSGLRSIAHDRAGRLRRLTPEMLRAIAATGRFDIPSSLPQPHTFMVTPYLQAGAVARGSTLTNGVAAAVELVAYLTPRMVCAFRHPQVKVTVPDGAWNMARAVLSLVDLFVGMPAHADRSHDAARAVAAARARFITAGMRAVPHDGDAASQPHARVYRLPNGSELDLRVLAGEALSTATDALRGLEAEVRATWSKEQHQWEQRYLADLLRDGTERTDEELSQLVAAANVDERHRRFVTALRTQSDVPGVDTLLTMGTAQALLRVAADGVQEAEAAARHRAADDFAKAHPFLSRMAIPRAEAARRVSQRLDAQRTAATYDASITAVANAQLPAVEHMLRRDQQFINDVAPKVKAAVAQDKQPASVLRFKRRLWRPSSWRVQRIGERYSLEPNGKYHVVEVPTSTCGWRLAALLVTMVTWTSNAAFGLVVSLAVGPLSLRALLGCSKYHPDKRIDPTTGQPVADTSVTITPLVSLIASLWRSVRTTMRDFEARPDSSLLPKSCLRLMHRCWYNVLVLCGGTLLLIVGFPLLCVLNTVVCLLLLVAAPVWVVAVCILVYLVDVLLFDHRGVRPSSASQWRQPAPMCCGVGLPLLSTLAFFMFGLLEVVLAAVVAASSPLLAVLLVVFHVVYYLLRTLRDAVCMCCVLRPCGRQPSADSCVARRVSGPGMARRVFHLAEPVVVLLLVRLHLELVELQLFADNHRRRLAEPAASFRRWVSSLLRPFDVPVGSAPTAVSDQQSQLEKALDGVVTARRKQLREYFLAVQHASHVRLTAESLAVAMRHGSALVEAFVRRRIAPRLDGPEAAASWWADQELPIDDFAGLTRRYVSKVLSADALVPLEDSDAGLRLHVRPSGLRAFLRGLEHGEAVHDLSDVSVVFPRIQALAKSKDLHRRTRMRLATTGDMLRALKARQQGVDAVDTFSPSAALALVVLPSDVLCTECHRRPGAATDTWCACSSGPLRIVIAAGVMSADELLGEAAANNLAAGGGAGVGAGAGTSGPTAVSGGVGEVEMVPKSAV